MYGVAVARLDNSRREIMKNIASALAALAVRAVIASIAARAMDAKTVYDQRDRVRF